MNVKEQTHRQLSLRATTRITKQNEQNYSGKRFEMKIKKELEVIGKVEM